MAQTGEWFLQLPRGTGSEASLYCFRERGMDYRWRALARRSQRGCPKPNRMQSPAARYLPLPHILHPYPLARFVAKHPSQPPHAFAAPVRICAGGAHIGTATSISLSLNWRGAPEKERLACLNLSLYKFRL